MEAATKLPANTQIAVPKRVTTCLAAACLMVCKRRADKLEGMNTHAVSTEAGQDLPWSEVVMEVKAWRRACLHAFAQAQAAVTVTVVLLSETAGRDAGVHLRNLTGQRLGDLARTTGPTFAFSAESVGTAEALSDFRRYEELRTRLAHGFARIALKWD